MTTEEKTANQSKAQIYVAAYSDAQSMIDLAIEPTREHFNFIQAAITARNGYVARIEQKAVGYAVMSNSFLTMPISRIFLSIPIIADKISPPC